MNENEDDSDFDKTFKPLDIQSPNSSTSSPTLISNTEIETYNVDNSSKYKKIKLNPSSSSKSSFTESSSQSKQQIGLMPRGNPEVSIINHEINNDQLQSNNLLFLTFKVSNNFNIYKFQLMFQHL